MEQLSDYHILEKIGSGASSDVYVGCHNKINHQFAIKIFKKDAYLIAEEEANLLRSLNHPNIVQFYDIIKRNINTGNHNQSEVNFQRSSHDHENSFTISIVMEYASNGSLQTRLPLKDEETIFKYFSQICDAIEYLHEVQNIVHRDLKFDNILLDKYDHVKLVDFGLSKKCQEHLLETRCGSPLYSSPEIILSEKYDFKTDIWSLGIILYYMCFGYFPFYSENIQQLFNQIIEQDIVFPENLRLEPNETTDESQEKSSVSPFLIHLIQKMLEKDPSQRADISSIKQHPWYVMMQSDRNGRESAFRLRSKFPKLIQFYDYENYGFSFDEYHKKAKTEKYKAISMIIKSQKGLKSPKLCKPCFFSPVIHRMSQIVDTHPLCQMNGRTRRIIKH
ncbi:CAMK family protein kinase [Tritrichomonas foetus]|uniref:CAMK family protein kinase n=1 Tax=Tritrichomonas foetus TaxID=1144522 RepID=A0A1J4JGI2_9EUKA|nr:CAMK family protein kinase [Tritrichomonas foetus]|eukprot:OHS97777.1 CAMK family protein kinase [Tritrichomonas foetus]